jgi:hypothetical protein
MVGVSFGALAYAGAALPVGLPAASSLLVPRAWSRAILFGGKTLGWVYLAAVLTLLTVAAWQHLRLRLILRCGLETVGYRTDGLDSQRRVFYRGPDRGHHQRPAWRTRP